MNKTAANAKLLLTLSGLSANILAPRLGVQQPTFTRIAAGKSKEPEDSTLLPIVTAIGVTTDEFRRVDLDTPDYRERVREALSRLPPKATPFDRKLQQSWAYRMLEMDIDQLRQLMLNVMDVLSASAPGAAELLEGLHDAVPKDYREKGFHGRALDTIQNLKKRDAKAPASSARRASP
jgi:transcriptional regulator with XRE-family HTH domain